MRPIPIRHGHAGSSVGDRGLCSSNPRARTAQGAACGRDTGEDRIASAVRKIFLEETTSGQLLEGWLLMERESEEFSY